MVEALLNPPGVVGKLSNDEPETAEGDLECRVVEGVISSSFLPCVTMSASRRGQKPKGSNFNLQKSEFAAWELTT